jgi:Protein of unknown function (DUF2911)
MGRGFWGLAGVAAVELALDPMSARSGSKPGFAPRPSGKYFALRGFPAIHFCAEVYRTMVAPIVWRAVCVSLLLSVMSPWLAAQADAAGTATTSCNLEDGRQVYMRYNPVSGNKEKPPNGKAWAPGGVPMTLFTEAQLSLGSSVIPVGAYSVFPIPARDHWTLVVNKNVTPGAAYDEKQDIARGPMETAQVASPAEALEVAFAHVGARCTLRIYVGKTASFADFTAK